MPMLALISLLLSQQASPVPTELPIRLAGVLLADEPADRAAVIRDERTGRFVTVREGGVVATAQVVQISSGRVLLRTWGRLETISSVTAWTERRSCASLLRDRAALVNAPDQARIVPAFHDGQPLGFKIFAVRPDSYISRAGLENGDLVVGVNGMHLRTPDEFLIAYSKLRCAQRITLTIIRDGEELQLALP